MGRRCRRSRALVSVLVLAVAGCKSNAPDSTQDHSLPPAEAALVKNLRDRIAAAVAVSDPDPTTLPRCRDTDIDALLLDTGKAREILGQPPVRPSVSTNELMQSYLACGEYWWNLFRDVATGGLKPAARGELERTAAATVAFCYVREDVPAEFSGCGVPDPSTKVMQCDHYKPGHSVIDLVEHPANGPLCAHRVVVDHPRSEVELSARGRAVEGFLARYFSRRRADRRPCDFDPSVTGYRFTVDDQVVCAGPVP